MLLVADQMPIVVVAVEVVTRAKPLLGGSVADDRLERTAGGTHRNIRTLLLEAILYPGPDVHLSGILSAFIILLKDGPDNELLAAHEADTLVDLSFGPDDDAVVG